MPRDAFNGYFDGLNSVNEAVRRSRAYTPEMRLGDAKKAREAGDYRRAGELESQARNMAATGKPYRDFE